MIIIDDYISYLGGDDRNRRITVSTNRRQMLRSAVALAGAAAAIPLLRSSAVRANPVPANQPIPLRPLPRGGAHLVLLGTTAGPVPMLGRTGIATALVVDGAIYLIDMGHGAFDQFQKSNLAIGDLQNIFVTHLHSDHLADLYTLLWLRFGGYDSMDKALDVYGPGSAGALPAPSSGQPVGTVNPQNPTPGVSDFIASSMAATAYDLNLRMRDEAWPDIRDLVRVHEIPVPDVGASPTGLMAPAMQPFPVMSDDRVRVSAILVEHPPVFPSFAFRFDTAYGSVVFSGDTTITGNMVTLARNADVLVHEAIDLQAVERFGNLTAEQLQHHRNAYSDVSRLGGVARDANVGTLVLSHLAPGTKALPDMVWMTKASKGFPGRVIVGDDLMRIPLRPP
jgi:ribonuclease BN (tRNA processing enzyme)